MKPCGWRSCDTPLRVHESQANVGIGGEIVARIYEEAPHLLRTPARRLGMAPVSIPVSKSLEEQVLPWKDQMKAMVLNMMEEKPAWQPN